MNLTNRSSDSYNSANSYNVILSSNSPSENDLMFALLLRQGGAASPTTIPSGWALVPGTSAHDINTLDHISLWYKLASASEPADYTWQWGGAQHGHGNITVWYGNYDTADLFNVVSDTIYSTENTIIRAASMDVTQSDAAALWFGGVFDNTDPSITAPSGWSTGISAGNTDSDLWSRVCVKILSSTGATGNVDGSVVTTYDKHAYMLALNGIALNSSGKALACCGF